MLTYDKCIIFVELKSRDIKNNEWCGKGDEQLRNTIRVFMENHSLDGYKSKKAYICNNKRPNFQFSQIERMAKFKKDMHLRLIIKNTIEI